MLILSIVLLGILVFFLLGLHIAAGIGVLSFILMVFVSPRPMIGITGQMVWNVSSTSVLIVVPMFIMMGEILLRAGLSERLYRCFAAWFNRVPGGLLQSNIAACAAFASMCGSTAATAATIGRVALPEFRGRGYNEPLVVGSLAAGGTLGVLIPPSVILIVYGVLAQESIGAMYMAGIVPGILLTLVYMLTIYVVVKLNPSFAPAEQRSTWSEKISATIAIIPVGGLILLVLGTIYMGVATVTESASLGVVGALLLAAYYKRLNMGMLKEVLLNTVNTTSMVVLIIAAAFLLTTALSLLGVPRALAGAISELGWEPLYILALIIVFYMILGMFMDAYSMMVTTVPVILPLISGLGFDLIWFGILMTLLVEMALISPPHGLNLFILHNIRKQVGVEGSESIGVLYKGVMPFIVSIFVVILLIIAIPEIVTWMPSNMRK